MNKLPKQRILISNDDGYSAKGINALIEVAKQYGDVTVVAPEVGMSGMSHAITMKSPVFLRTVKESEGLNIYACSGTPVDCIKLALDYLMDEKPTLILSGINHGSNSGLNVVYSGTMGAAREGSFYGIPSIGFSTLTHNPDADFTTCVEVAHRVISKVLQNNTNGFMCLNVNVPDIALTELKGIAICHQTKGYWTEDFEKRVNPSGQTYFWLTGRFHNTETNTKTSDEHALENNYASVVPIKADTTDYCQLETMKNWGLYSRP